MINLKDNPFYLSDEDIKWVYDTLSKMTTKQKIGQLFFLTAYGNDREYLLKVAKEIEAGGLMFRPIAMEDLVKGIATLQENSNIPMLISANLESGGNGICKEGTKVGSQMAIAATDDTFYASKLGEICAKEALAVGCNYAFAPVTDIDFNFRNPITNTRTYGSNVDRVLNMSKAYMKACQDLGVAVSIKHFPGDGVDERDQHLLTSINSLYTEEWDKTYGKIYKTLIDNGAKTVMVGHIMQPCYSKFLNPSLKDEDILPASLSKELLNDLLRKRLGFNGLIISDATTMTGFCQPMGRKKAVPYAISAGCDIFLFTKNLEEDYKFMIDGYNEGVITDERLNEAVTRILALKASLNLNKKNNIPNFEDAKKVVGKKEFKVIAREVADKSITLVKEEKGVLPINKSKVKNILVYDIESGENALGYVRESGIGEKFINLLKKEGFNVTLFEAGGRFEGKQVKFEDMVNNFDLLIYVCNLATKSNQTTVRIEWMNPMGVNCPIYINNIPTIFISTENPYHLLDVPRMKTFINCYMSNEFTLDLLIDKLMGRSKFKGISPIDPFCGKWDTKL